MKYSAYMCDNVYILYEFIWLHVYMCKIVNYNLSAPDPRDKGFVETGACSHVFLFENSSKDGIEMMLQDLQTPEKL